MKFKGFNAKELDLMMDICEALQKADILREMKGKKSIIKDKMPFTSKDKDEQYLIDQFYDYQSRFIQTLVKRHRGRVTL